MGTTIKEILFKVKRRLFRIAEVCSDSFLLWKYRNRPYIEYYRAVMKRNTALDPKSAVGAVGDSVGIRQLYRMKIHGLKPENTFFDLGCGCLRGGIHLIGYLNEGNYTGNDISADILKAAQDVLKESGLENKKPSLHLTENMQFNEVAGKTFDYVHAQSVLTHMPPEDIEELFKNVSKIMHKDSQFITTFFLAKGDSIYPSNQKRNFHYPFKWMQDTCAKHNLNVEIAEDAPEFSGKQTLMRIMRA